MPEQRQIVVGEIGERNTSKGPIRYIKDLDGNEYATWSTSVIPYLAQGAVVAITFETTRRPRNDGGFFENNKLLHVEAGPQAQIAPAPPVQSGAFASPTMQVQNANERTESIVRQTAGKCAATIVGGLYSGAGTYNHEHSIAIRQITAMMYAFFMTGEWSDTLTDLAPISGNSSGQMDDDEDLPF